MAAFHIPFILFNINVIGMMVLYVKEINEHTLKKMNKKQKENKKKEVYDRQSGMFAFHNNENIN